MTHPYNDYDTCFSDVWGGMVNQAEGEVDELLGEWFWKLLAENIPGCWYDEYHERMEEDVAERKVEFLEALIARLRAEPKPAQSVHELKTMMRDPLYWRDQDPEIVEAVREGFRALYSPEKQG